MTLSEIQKQAIRDALNNGATQKDVASRMNVSLRTVKYIASDMKGSADLHEKVGGNVEECTLIEGAKKVQKPKVQKHRMQKSEVVEVQPMMQTYIPTLPHINRHEYSANRLLEIQLENLETETRLYRQTVASGDPLSVMHQKNIQKILDTLGKWYGMDNLYAQPKNEIITVENDARLEEAKRIIDSDPELRKVLQNDG